MAHFRLAPDLSGQRFGSWTVIKRDGSMPYGGAAFLCRCDCGTDKRVNARTLRKGDSTSCGCFFRSDLGRRSTTHGLSKHPLYAAWASMKGRCYYKKHMYFAYYGGRGIRVCDRWMAFEPFYEDNIDIYRAGLTLDREDNDADYSPNNCRWVDMKTQNRNRSNTVKMTLHGETLPLVVWSEKLGITAVSLYQRRASGWSDERALTTPTRRHG